MKLVAILMAYNELSSGNLDRCVKSLQKYCDEIVVYDDASNDGSQDYYRQNGLVVIQGAKNDFKNELTHKQMQLEKCKEIGADWIFRIDADEVIDRRGETSFRDFVSSAFRNGYAFHTINFWRSPNFYRLDSGYNDVIFNRLWKCVPDLHFNIQEGLHLTNYPVGVTNGEGFAPFEILHYGFASNKAIIDKYHMYKNHGQSGWALSRLLDESNLRLSRSKREWFENPLEEVKFEEVFSAPIASYINER